MTLIENPLLPSLEGLHNLTAVGSSVYVRKNLRLKSLAALTSLRQIGGLLTISENDIVPTAEFCPTGNDVHYGIREFCAELIEQVETSRP